MRLLASSHRFIHALMALDADGCTRQRFGHVRAFHAIHSGRGETLASLAAALAARACQLNEFPDLREIITCSCSPAIRRSSGTRW